MPRLTRRICARWVLAILFLVAVGQEASADSNRAPRVLALHSFSADPDRISSFDQITVPALEKILGRSVDVYTEYLELDRFPEDDYRRILIRNLKSLYQNRSIDVIVPIEFQALDFTRSYLSDVFPGVPIVFVSVESSQIQGLSFAPNITGVVHKDDWLSAIREILRIHPDTQQVVVFGGSSPMDHENLEEKRKIFQPFENKVRFRYLTDLPLLDMLAITRRLPPKSVIIQISFRADSQGHALPDSGLLYETANAPVYSLVGRNLGKGLVGGPVPAFQERYLAGAKMIARVLKGEKPTAIPIQTAVPEHPMAFDWRQLQRWGINEKLLPARSLVSFREPPPWEQYKWEILISILIGLAEGALILALLVQRSRRRRAEHEVRDLAGKLIVAQEEERKRIARELHDDLSQQLAAVGLSVSSIRRDMASSLPKEYRKFEELQYRLTSLHDDIHRLSHNLHPALIETVGLSAALRQYAHNRTELTGVVVDVKINLASETVPHDAALCLYRVAQESLRNVVKHSGARRAEISLNEFDDALELTVRDWGEGFDSQGKTPNGGLGLTSMKERVRLAGGVLDIESAPREGTRIRARLPFGEAFQTKTMTAKTGVA
ncbi:MAG TPA: ATP-binding protein [Bryobacteraceae bacterium]|nr:ATP-binding protein [Bryobacteraceae bacterium]